MAAALGIAVAAHGQQQNAPRIGYVSPAGARQGTSLMVMAGGQFLDGANNVLVSGDGVEAKVVEYFKAINEGQANGVRDKLKKLLEKKAQAEAAAAAAAAVAAAPPPAAPGAKPPPAPPRPPKIQWTAADEMMANALRKKFAAALRGRAVPATAESVLVHVTVAPGAAAGRRELRLETPKGWTNPLAFCIGPFEEFAKEPPLDAALQGKPKPKSPADLSAPPPAPPTPVTLPCVANGQIAPGGADRYTFEARKGQRLVIASATRTLIPYISDAVPGWFQAALTLFDDAGQELAYADHYRFDPEPVLLHEIARDGRYTVEIRDALYRGREDFVYRLALGELPFVTTAFPLGGRSGAKTTVELAGWNLPASSLVLDNRDRPPGLYPFAVDGSGTFGAWPFAVDDLPEQLDDEPNGEPDGAQTVRLPLVVNGRIDKRDDRDLFQFEGKAGEEIVAEVHARRLRSPLDSMLLLYDSAGRLVASNDDHEDKASGLNTHHSDSYLRATLPAAGGYVLHLVDAQHNGGPEYAYRLRIGSPRPDFELRVAPSHVIARAGTSVPVTVFALRKDGFAGPIDFALKDASEGLTLEGGQLAPDKDQADLKLKVLYWTGREALPRLSLEGRAMVAGQEIRRVALPAEHMTQAFEYRHLVPAGDLRLTVTGRLAPRISIKIASPTPVKLAPGQEVRVKFAVSPPGYLEGTQLAWAGKPPAGIDLEGYADSAEGLELVLRCDPAKVKPGSRGNLALAATAKPPPPPAAGDKDKRPANLLRVPPPRLPSIPFQVVKP